MLSSQFPRLSSPPSVPPPFPPSFGSTSASTIVRRSGLSERPNAAAAAAASAVVVVARAASFPTLTCCKARGAVSNGVVGLAGGSARLRAGPARALADDGRSVGFGHFEFEAGHLSPGRTDPLQEPARPPGPYSRHEHERGRCDLHFAAFRSNALLLPTCSATQVTGRARAVTGNKHVVSSCRQRGRTVLISSKVVRTRADGRGAGGRQRPPLPDSLRAIQDQSKRSLSLESDLASEKGRSVVGGCLPLPNYQTELQL